MKFLIFVFMCLMSTESHCKQHLTGIIPTTAIKVPFLAVINVPKRSWYTIGALLSRTFVIAMADPSMEHDDICVYLGFSQSPQFADNYQYRNGCRIIDVRQVLWHEDLGRTNRTHELISDMALLRLDSPASFSETVRPILLPSRKHFPLSPLTFANVIGFDLNSPSGTPEYTTVQLRSEEKCKLFFGDTIIQREEFCVRTNNTALDNPKFAYYPIVWEGKLVGFGRTALAPAVCQVTSESCKPYQVYTSLDNSLDWIYDNVDVIYND